MLGCCFAWFGVDGDLFGIIVVFVAEFFLLICRMVLTLVG